MSEILFFFFILLTNRWCSFLRKLPYPLHKNYDKPEKALEQLKIGMLHLHTDTLRTNDRREILRCFRCYDYCNVLLQLIIADPTLDHSHSNKLSYKQKKSKN